MPPPEISIVAYPLPLPGSPEAPPTFNGRNVSSFLKRYKSMCDNYQIQEPIRIKRVSEYYKDNVAREIKAFITWKEKD
jgi:hypothetical protein